MYLVVFTKHVISQDVHLAGSSHDTSQRIFSLDDNIWLNLRTGTVAALNQTESNPEVFTFDPTLNGRAAALLQGNASQPGIARRVITSMCPFISMSICSSKTSCSCLDDAYDYRSRCDVTAACIHLVTPALSRGDCHVMVVLDRYRPVSRAQTGYQSSSAHSSLPLWLTGSNVTSLAVCKLNTAADVH